jgi:hypothetical protein
MPIYPFVSQPGERETLKGGRPIRDRAQVPAIAQRLARKNPDRLVVVWDMDTFEKLYECRADASGDIEVVSNVVTDSGVSI